MSNFDKVGKFMKTFGQEVNSKAKFLKKNHKTEIRPQLQRS